MMNLTHTIHIPLCHLFYVHRELWNDPYIDTNHQVELSTANYHPCALEQIGDEVKDISSTLIQSQPRTYSFNPQAEPDLPPDLSRCLSRDLEICPLICVRAGKIHLSQKKVSWATELHGWKWKNDVDTFMLRSWLSRTSTLHKTNSSYLKIGIPKIKVVSQPPFFRGYDSFREGSSCELFIVLEISFLEQS